MSELALVISCDRGRMTDERTGEIRPWANAYYITDYRESGENAMGYKPIKVSCSDEAFFVLNSNGPGMYQLDFQTRPGAGGKPALALVKAVLVKPIDIFGDPVPLRPSAKPAEKPASAPAV